MVGRQCQSSLFPEYQHTMSGQESEESRKRKLDDELVEGKEETAAKFLKPLDSGPSEFVVNLVNTLFVEGLDTNRALSFDLPQNNPFRTTHTLPFIAHYPLANNAHKSPLPMQANPWVYRTKRHMVMNWDTGFPIQMQVRPNPGRMINPRALPFNPQLPHQITLPHNSQAQFPNTIPAKHHLIPNPMRTKQDIIVHPPTSNKPSVQQTFVLARQISESPSKPMLLEKLPENQTSLAFQKFPVIARKDQSQNEIQRKSLQELNKLTVESAQEENNVSTENPQKLNKVSTESSRSVQNKRGRKTK